MSEANTSAESMETYDCCVVWFASNYVQCIYFKFRKHTQEISKMRRNWQRAECKTLMTWIIQPVNRSRQEGEGRGERWVPLFTLYTADGPDRRLKSGHTPRSCHILYLYGEAGLCGSHVCHGFRSTKAMPQTDFSANFLLENRFNSCV